MSESIERMILEAIKELGGAATEQQIAKRMGIRLREFCMQREPLNNIVKNGHAIVDSSSWAYPDWKYTLTSK